MKKARLQSSLKSLIQNASRAPLLLPEIYDEILVVEDEENFNAISTICPHMGGPLRPCANNDLVCEWHDWKFSRTTGECINRDVQLKLNRYKISEQGGESWIEIV